MPDLHFFIFCGLGTDFHVTYKGRQVCGKESVFKVMSIH